MDGSLVLDVSRWRDLYESTSHKIRVQAGKKEHNLRRLVLLCNTYDARMDFYPAEANTVNEYDSFSDAQQPSEDHPPPYELYYSPEIEVNVEECHASSSDDTSSSDEEYESQIDVPNPSPPVRDNCWSTSKAQGIVDGFNYLRSCPSVDNFMPLLRDQTGLARDLAQTKKKEQIQDQYLYHQKQSDAIVAVTQVHAEAYTGSEPLASCKLAAWKCNVIDPLLKVFRAVAI
jgi:hypothetical protein